MKGVRNLYADGRVPSGYSKKGDLVYNSKGKLCMGSCQYLGKHKSDVYLFKAAFVCKEQLYLTMGHEYMHVTFNNYGLMNIKLQHKAIYMWQYEQAVALSYNVDYYKTYVPLVNLPSTSKYNIRPFQIIELVK